MALSAEHERLIAHRARRTNWRNWGPYVSERAWGTVREDYSPHGEAWDFLPHDHARSKAYRWNEDGLAGISDREQHLCFALALWNGHDTILKERLFGLTGPQGNHGEDVKEYYFYLDSTPTHSYMKMLYKYPHRAFPYTDLLRENARRTPFDFEYELLDTGIFDGDAYFDVFVEYAKASQEDILIQITAVNRGSNAAPLALLPTVWFRNMWSWGYDDGPQGKTPYKPSMQAITPPHDGVLALQTHHATYGTYYLYAEAAQTWLFTENETHNERLYGTPNATPYVKDAFHRYVIDRMHHVVNPDERGTKAAALYQGMLDAGEQVTLRLRLSKAVLSQPFADFDDIHAQRINEADDFYNMIHPATLTDEERALQRQAFAGMLWTKQLYYLDMEQWLDGDPIHPAQRQMQRNADWSHMVNFDIMSMPDKWEYPWYATWDTAFHCLPLVLVDPGYAKRQLELFTREWYMHPNGQFPAYEWHFDDVNPPVHAWAVLRVYQIDAQMTGQPDRAFLEGMFHKLLLNFTWWVNRKDADGNNVFDGGFLGLDNISVFDRSSDLPTGGRLEQSDGTAWMGFYCIEMMRIALELAKDNPVYQDSACKFFEHFLRIATAMSNSDGEQPFSLWDERDGFFYDALHLPDDRVIPLRVRSLVGLLPLICVETLGAGTMESMPVFDRRTHWFIENRPHLAGHVASIDEQGAGKCRQMALLTRERLVRVLRYMLDEDEFLSPYGIRSLSKYHEKHPFSVRVGGRLYEVRYLPAESDNHMFGGNSNWRGPVWFPINFLIIEALRKYYVYYGDTLQVEFPTGSGNMLTLQQVADELSERLLRIFKRGRDQRRPVYGGQGILQDDPHWRDYFLFYEYFHGDNGAGLGASHQTGWTGLVANLLQNNGGF